MDWGTQSAFPVRICPVLNVLACTWQSHVALQVIKITGYSHTEKAALSRLQKKASLVDLLSGWETGLGTNPLLGSEGNTAVDRSV